MRGEPGVVESPMVFPANFGLKRSAKMRLEGVGVEIICSAMNWRFSKM